MFPAVLDNFDPVSNSGKRTFEIGYVMCDTNFLVSGCTYIAALYFVPLTSFFHQVHDAVVRRFVISKVYAPYVMTV